MYLFFGHILCSDSLPSFLTLIVFSIIVVIVSIIIGIIIITIINIINPKYKKNIEWTKRQTSCTRSMLGI